MRSWWVRCERGSRFRSVLRSRHSGRPWRYCFEMDTGATWRAGPIAILQLSISHFPVSMTRISFPRHDLSSIIRSGSQRYSTRSSCSSCWRWTDIRSRIRIVSSIIAFRTRIVSIRMHRSSCLVSLSSSIYFPCPVPTRWHAVARG